MAENLGVTCAICTHNGALRIGPTLESVLIQKASPDLAWEVLIIDNASTDDLRGVVSSVWDEERSKISLRIVKEGTLGLSHARHKAFQEARFPIISFIDDDVRVNENWVQAASDIMSSDTTCGALGGFGIGVFDEPPPQWFERHQERFVIGPQGQVSGDVTETERTLWGAGLTLRMDAINQLMAEGFVQLLTGRQGNVLLCGEDTELSLALRLAGWRIFYEPSLTYEHSLPRERVNWQFMRRWYRGFGAASLSFDAYIFAREAAQGRSVPWYQKRWQCKLLGILLRIFKDPVVLLKALSAQCENDDSAVWLEYKLGRLIQLCKIRSQYEKDLATVLNAKWRRELLKR